LASAKAQIEDLIGRRLKIIPNGFAERAVLKLMFSAMTRAAERWHAIRISDFQRRQMTAVKREFDQEYEARIGLLTSRQRMHPTPEFPAHGELDLVPLV